MGWLGSGACMNMSSSSSVSGGGGRGGGTSPPGNGGLGGATSEKKTKKIQPRVLFLCKIENLKKLTKFYKLNS